MRYALALSVPLAALSLVACAPAPLYQPATAAEAAAMARCDVQAMQVGSGYRNVYEAAAAEGQARGLCMRAWRLEQMAAADARAASAPPEPPPAVMSTAPGLRTRLEAEAHCQGAADFSACVFAAMAPPAL